MPLTPFESDVATWIWTGEALARFLDATPGRRRYAELPTSAVCLKQSGDAQHADGGAAVRLPPE